MKRFLNVIDGLLDDIKILLTIILTIAGVAFISGIEAVNEAYLVNYVGLILFVLILIDLLLYLLNLLYSIFANGILSTLGSLIINLIPFVITFFVLVLLQTSCPTLGNFEAAPFVLYSLVLIAFSLFTSSSSDEEDEDDEDAEDWGGAFKFLVFYEKLRLIAVIVSICLFLFYELQGSPSASLLIASLVISMIIMISDIVLIVVDFRLGDGEAFDYITLVLNCVLIVGFIVFVFCGHLFSKPLLSLIGLPNIDLSSLTQKLCFGFILYVIIDILLSIPINIISGVSDIVRKITDND